MRRAYVHPMLARASFWRGVTARAEGPAPILIELPGHGQAPAPEGPYLDAAVARIADAVGDEPVHLVGLSFGAVASLAHVLRGGHVAALTLIEPVLFAAASGAPEAAAHAAEAEPFEAAMMQGDRAAAARAFHGLWGAGAWDDLPEPVRAVLAGGMRWVAETGPVLHDDSGGLLAPGGLEGIEVPVLLAGGRESPAVTRAILDALGARIPNATRAAIDGAGHLSAMTHPAEVAALLDGFEAGLG